MGDGISELCSPFMYLQVVKITRHSLAGILAATFLSCSDSLSEGWR